METPKGSTPNPSGVELRRRLTTPALAQQQPQSISRPQNAQNSSSALGASFYLFFIFREIKFSRKISVFFS